MPAPCPMPHRGWEETATASSFPQLPASCSPPLPAWRYAEYIAKNRDSNGNTGSLFFRLDHLFFFCAGAGLDSSTRGAIRMGGKGISALNANQLADYRAAYVGFVLQSCNLIPALTVIENAALVKEIAPNPLSSHDLLRAVGLADHHA